MEEANQEANQGVVVYSGCFIEISSTVNILTDFACTAEV